MNNSFHNKLNYAVRYFSTILVISWAPFPLYHLAMRPDLFYFVV